MIKANVKKRYRWLVYVYIHVGSQVPFVYTAFKRVTHA